MLEALKEKTNVAFTQNGARAYATTNSSLLDLYAQGGALRSSREAEVLSLYTKAFAEDNLLALKMLFYFRDIRGGAGERNTFKTILRYMANVHTEKIAVNIDLIPFYGRWDDLYSLVGTKLQDLAFGLIASQFSTDIKAEKPSLMAKWLKSENASSKATKELATLTRKALGLSSRQYRKALSSLRARISIIETQMSQNDWNIDYSKLPSQAGMRYRKAFFRHDEAGYLEFLSHLEKGETKVNTKTLFPYEIIRPLFTGGMVQIHSRKNNVEVRPYSELDQAINLTWDNLPNYFGENTDNSLAVVDTSGSMRGLPIEIAISLGIYAAERNKGKFHNHFVTFSDTPEIVEIKGSNICEKVRNLSKANWDNNTNIEAVFDLILDVALENNLPQEQMISRLFIISDMEFDAGVTSSRDVALFEAIREKYADAGYQLPNVVFWNVNARTRQVPSTISTTGVQLVSGASPTTFTNLLKGTELTAYELMLQTLNSERYSLVTV